MGSAKASLRSGGEGLLPLPNHVCGDGFSGDPSAQATMAPLMEVLANPALSALRRTFDQSVSKALPSTTTGIAWTASTDVQTPGA